MLLNILQIFESQNQKSARSKWNEKWQKRLKNNDGRPPSGR